MNKPCPELLAPAGNMERFYAALHFGADAVYVGAQSMSLRNFADNFTPAELVQICTYAHGLGKKVYVACNAFPRDEDIRELPKLFEAIAAANADALIVNDAGVIRVAKRTIPDMPLHLSTQANTLNSETALFWHEQGIKRIILARELSLKQIKAMRQALPGTLELEMFVHGAMCVSYSGRCLLSNYMDGRDSNRGECAQPCRWGYELREKGKDGDFYSIEEDEKGSFILNAKDLNLISRLSEIIDAGICSLKIEGRMKSVAYVATIVNAYRMALDAWEKGIALPKSVLEETEHASHRPYTEGFAFEGDKETTQYTHDAQYLSDMRIAAVVLRYDEEKSAAFIEQRNRFSVSSRLSILSPRDIERSCLVKSIKTETGEELQSAPHPKERLWIEIDEKVKAGDLLRLYECGGVLAPKT